MVDGEVLEIGNYIGGEFVGSLNGEWLDVVEPATGRLFARAPLSEARDVELAVEAAKSAQPSWGAIESGDRAAWLDKIAEALEARHEELSALESRDTGKPISLARSVDAARSVENFRFFANLLREQEQESFEMDDATNFVVSKPVGIGALVTPWNLPLYLLSWKMMKTNCYTNYLQCQIFFDYLV